MQTWVQRRHSRYEQPVEAARIAAPAGRRERASPASWQLWTGHRPAPQPRTDPRSPVLEPACSSTAPPGRDFAGLPVYAGTPVRLQAKLRVNTPGDEYEQEADQAADHVEDPVGDGEWEYGSVRNGMGRGDALSAEASGFIGGDGEPLDESTRRFFEIRFGHGFGGVRVHADAGADRGARSLDADSYTIGRHISFARGRYQPGTTRGRQLLAHELTHVVQQARSAGSAGSGVALMVMRQKTVPSQLDTLEAQLKEKKREREELRKSIEGSVDQVARQRIESTSRRDFTALKQRAQSDLQLIIPEKVLEVLHRVVTVVRKGDTYVLKTRIELSYGALPSKSASERAKSDIPRLTRAIGDAWTVNMKEGRYAGRRFLLEPTITYRDMQRAGSDRALQIIVRGPDEDPSTVAAGTGTMDLAARHLEGDRIIVVAHEFYHLFGFFDAYLIGEMPSSVSLKGRQTQWAVGRADPARRPDLLGLVDPEGLRERLKKGEISKTDYERQTGGAPTVWAEDAEQILYALGVKPVPETERPLPPRDSKDFPDAALRRLRAMKQVGEQRVAELEAQTARADAARKSVEMAERAIRLDVEISALEAQIKQLRRP